MVREDATGTVYYGSTNDLDFNEAMGLLQSGGGELNTGTLRIQFGSNSSDRHYIRVYYTWMDDAHWVVKADAANDNRYALGYTIFISASGDAYAYFTSAYESLSSPYFGMYKPSYIWDSGSDGASNISQSMAFIKYATTNVVGTGKTAKSAIALLAGIYGTTIYVYENNRSGGSYSGGKLSTTNSGNSANFTLLGPICDEQSTGVATSAKFTAMNSQEFSAGDYMIGGHRFKHVGSGIFLYGESN